MIKDFDSWVAAARSAGWQVSGREHRIFRDPDHAIDPEMKVSSFALYCFVKQYFHDLLAQDLGAFSFPFFVAPEPLPLSYVLRDGWKIDGTDLPYLLGPPGGPPIFKGGEALELGSADAILDLQQACSVLDIDETLLKWFTKRSFNGRKLVPRDVGELEFDRGHVEDFLKHLSAPWPGTGRKEPPAGVKRYIRLEAANRCQLCQLEKPNYEWAHVEAWARTRNNSPHNLLMLCLDCHTTQGSNELQLKDVKSAARRRFKLMHEKVAQVLFDGIVPGSRIAIVDEHDAWDYASLLVNELVGEDGTLVVDLPEGCEAVQYRIRKGSDPPYKPLEGLAYAGRLHIQQESDS